MSLTPAQRRAVESRARRVVVLAPAGAGKTTTICERLVSLLEEGVPAERILALAFTRKAATELRRRVRDRAGDAAAGLQATTMHAWIVSVLRAPHHAAALGLSPSFTVLDEGDALQVLRAAARDLGLGKVESATATQLRARAKGRAGALDGVYRRRLTRMDAIDYDGLEHAMLALLLDRSGTAAALSDAWHEAAVDEAQDLSERQWRIIERLDPAALCVVACPEQAIYGWRNARPENVRDAVADAIALDGDVVHLDVNFRSGPALVLGGVRIARALGEHTAVRADRTDAPGRVLVDRHRDTYDSAASIVAHIMDNAFDGGGPDDVMVLARTWAELAPVATALRAAGVPFTLGRDHLDPWATPAVRTLVAALRLRQNPRDQIAARQLLAWPRPAPAREVDAAILEADRRGHPVRDVAVERFLVPYLEGLGDVLLTDPDEALEREVTVSDVASMWDLRDGIPAGALDALALVNDWTLARMDAGEPCDVAAFLTWHSLRHLDDAPDQAAVGVQLLTIHAAKGLEAPVVHVLGCDAGHWPSPRDAGRGDEALRLFYVACTRVRDVLVLHTNERRPAAWGGGYVNAGPSPYLDLVSAPAGVADLQDPCCAGRGGTFTGERR